MSVTREQLEEIKHRRQVYFASTEGREALVNLLARTGLLENPENSKATLDGLLFGLSLLWELGVLYPENHGRLVAKMAELPLPEPENE